MPFWPLWSLPMAIFKRWRGRRIEDQRDLTSPLADSWRRGGELRKSSVSSKVDGREPVRFVAVAHSCAQAVSETKRSREERVFTARETNAHSRASETEWRPSPPSRVGRWKKAHRVLVGRPKAKGLLDLLPHYRV